ncbi:MAG: transposase, partial [Nostoc sp.]
MNRPATRRQSPPQASLPKQFRFEQPKSPPVVVNFSGGLVTSDAGLNLIAEIDRKLQVTSQFAQCFQDYRKPYRIDHTVESLITQRIYGLVMGYEDLNDHEELQRVIQQIRQQWKNVEILVRGDSAYCRENIMAWCESQIGVDYVFGLAQNSRLLQMTTTTQNRAKLEFEQKLSTVVSFLETVFKPEEKLPEVASNLIDNSIWYKSLDYQTRESWSRSRRVVCKVEYGVKGTNIRFIVTSITTNKIAQGELYTQKYCPRGEMENRFKEQQLELFSDRTSTHTFAGN